MNCVYRESAGSRRSSHPYKLAGDPTQSSSSGWRVGVGKAIKRSLNAPAKTSL